ncbi:MAG: CHAD domain-containing protein [Phycisphaerae bacterium]|nr:CHAD domain-containing protein [Gemmatimonadaceae bacterium]
MRKPDVIKAAARADKLAVMPPAAPAETELKLQLDPRDVDRLRRSALLAEAACSEMEVDNVYFDTTDYLLHRHFLALRVREIDGRWLQTLKSGAEFGGSLSRRGEWETPSRVLRGRGRIDLSRFSDTPLQKLLAAQKDRPTLRPLFHTRFRRTQWLLQRSGTTLEVALDIGEITLAAGRKTLSKPICEVELELKQGEAAVLIDTALELLSIASGSPLVLTPISRSKAERGYQLIAQRPAPATKASAKGFVEGLHGKTTTARALRSVVAHGLAVLTVNAEMLQTYDDPEYVHQARVSLRRVRSAIRLFDRDQSDVPKAVVSELRWFARALGEARDWDVITDQTLPSLGNGVGADKVQPLIAKADQRRRRARVKIRQAVLTPRYAALVLNTERWCMTPSPAGAELLSALAALALGGAAKKLFKAARFFAALTPERRHEVRILAKRLRYALDLFSVALPKQEAARYIDALAELQDVLGELNDATVATDVLPQLSRSAQIRKAAQKWLASIEPERVLNAESRLLKLSKLRAPWV